MRIVYHCERCGQHIDVLEVEKIDEERFGFDCLTDEERRDIIKVDHLQDIMIVQSLCDQCIMSIGISQGLPNNTIKLLH